jgi:hypothetical protein
VEGLPEIGAMEQWRQMGRGNQSMYGLYEYKVIVIWCSSSHCLGKKQIARLSIFLEQNHQFTFPGTTEGHQSNNKQSLEPDYIDSCMVTLIS